MNGTIANLICIVFRFRYAFMNYGVHSMMYPYFALKVSCSALFTIAAM